MGIFGTFFFLLFIFFIVIPLCRLGWRAWMLHRQWRRATEDLRNAFSGNDSAKSGRADNAAPRRKKKKIDPTVGEYVAFEEIKTGTGSTQAHGTGNSISYSAESQIEDAIWEDIK